MNSAFSELVLLDKLSKLNSTQQCIETLSHFCIYHRKYAEQVVQAWEKQFRNSPKEQKTSLLYLANDILQNSRKTGTEFVIEFWKVLPAAVKDVNENGGDRGKNVVSRLVGIWEERRVFGSQARNLKDLLLGSEPLPALELNKKRSRSGSVKIIRRDSRSIRTKLSIGGTAEKIVSAIHSVTNEHPDEDTDLDKCNASVRRLEKMEKDVEIACARAGDPRRVSLAEEIKEEESTLTQCLKKIKSIEGSREALVSQLKEALREQESHLESVRTQIQVAQGQLEQAANMRRRLNNEPTQTQSKTVPDSNGPTTSDPKKTAAAIADKLAASTHSQQVLTSVLSSFAAEEANKNTRSKPENVNPVGPPSSSVTLPPLMPPQYSFFAPATQQYIQTPPGGMMIGLPYSYSGVPPPPAPPPPPAQMVNLVRPLHVSQQTQVQMLQASPQQSMVMQQQQQQQVQFGMQQQQPALPSYRPLQPPNLNIGFYPHQTQ